MGPFRRVAQPKTVIWAASQESNELDMEGQTAGLQLILPATFTGTTLKFKQLAPDGTFVTLQKNGSDVTRTVAGSAASCNVLSAGDAELFGLTKIKIVSDQSETCQAQLLCTG